MLGLFWPASIDPAILTVRAVPADEMGPDTLDVQRLQVGVAILRDRGREHIVIGDGPRHLRLEASSGSLADGPVRLVYDLADFRFLRPRLAALARLEALVRLGRLPASLYPSDPPAVRWLNALIALTMQEEGASQIEIAVELFGADSVDADSVDRMRKRVARLLELAERRVKVAHRRLLGTAPAS